MFPYRTKRRHLVGRTFRVVRAPYPGTATGGITTHIYEIVPIQDDSGSVHPGWAAHSLHDIRNENVPIQDDSGSVHPLGCTLPTKNVPIQDNDDFWWDAPSEWCALPTQVLQRLTLHHQINKYSLTRLVSLNAVALVYWLRATSVAPSRRL